MALDGHTEIPSDEIGRLAQECLLRAKPSSHKEDNDREILFAPRDRRSIDAMFVDWVHRTNRWSDFDHMVEQWVISGSAGRCVRNLRGMAALYRNEGDAFLTAARSFVAERSRSDFSIIPETAIMSLLDIWKKRGRNVDVRPLMIEFAALMAPFHELEYLDWLDTFIDVYSESASAEDLYQFLDRLTTVALAPQGERRQFVEQNSDDEGEYPGVEGSRIASFREFVQELFSEPMGGTLPMARVIDESQLWNPLGLWVDLKYWMDPTRTDHVLGFLKQDPFCCEIEKFRPMAGGGNRDYSTVLGTVMATFVNHTHFRDRYRDQIRQTFPDNFGTQVMLACLDEHPYASLLDEFARFRQQLDAMDPQQALSIAHFALDLQKMTRHQPSQHSTSAHVMHAWVQRRLMEREGQAIDRVLQARTMAEAGANNMRTWNELIERIRIVAQYDLERAVRAVSHVVQITRLDARMGRRHAAGQANETVSIMLRNLMDPTESAQNLALLMHAVTDSELSEILCFQGEFVRGLPDYLRHQSLEEETPDQFDDTVLARCKAIAVGNCAIDWLTLVATEAVGDGSRDDCDILVQKLAGSEPALDRWDRGVLNGARVYACATATTLQRAGDNRKQHPLPDECERHYVEVLKNDRLPNALRAAIASHLAGRLHDLIPNSILTLGMERLTEGLAKGNHRYLRVANPIMAVFLKRSEMENWTGLADAYIDAEDQSRKGHPTLDAIDSEVQQQVYQSLRLRVMRKDKPRIQSLVGDPNFAAIDAPDVIALLLDGGYEGVATEVAVRQGGRIQLTSPLRLGFEYTAQLADRIPAFLAAIESPELRQRMELALLNLNDPRSPPEPAVADNHAGADDRFVAMARRFPTETYPSDELRESVLLLLWKREKTRAILAPELEKLYPTLSGPEVHAHYFRDDTSRISAERRKELLFALLARKMQIGEFKYAQEQVDSILENSSEHDSIRHRAIVQILQQFIEAAAQNLDQWSHESLWPAAQLHRSTLPSCQTIGGPTMDVELGLLMLLHVASGHLQDMPSLADRSLVGYHQQYIQWMGKLVGEPQPANLDRRKELVLGYFDCLQTQGKLIPALTEWERHTGGLLRQPMGNSPWGDFQRKIANMDRASPFELSVGVGLLTLDEMEELAGGLAARVDAPDVVWGGLAQAQHRLGQREAAVRSIEKAIESLPDSPTDGPSRDRQQRWQELRHGWSRRRGR